MHDDPFGICRFGLPRSAYGSGAGRRWSFRHSQPDHLRASNLQLAKLGDKLDLVAGHSGGSCFRPNHHSWLVDSEF